MARDTNSYLKGAACGLAAVPIWAGWSVVTRFAVTTELDAWDIAALRFAVAGIVLAPVVLRRGLALDRLGWGGLAALLIGAGAPYVLVAAAGLNFAPAPDQGPLNPGCVPLFVALIAALGLKERIAPARRLGLALILVGALVLIGWHAIAAEAARSLGHVLFLAAAFLWAVFTVVMRRAQLEPLHATALVATGSLVLYLPLYLALHGFRLAELPPATLALQATYQGLLVTVVSLLLYGRAIAILGASSGAAFGALVPVVTALIAIPLLGEWPGRSDWLAIAVVSIGVYLASGGPLPRVLGGVGRGASER